MDLNYYLGLYLGYLIAIVGWELIARLLKIEPGQVTPVFEKPWLEFGLALAAIVLTLGIGQLYVRDLLLPTDGKLGFLLESLNQTFIFLPFPLLILLRRQSLQTAWIPDQNKGISIGIGLGLALLAIAAFGLVVKNGAYLSVLGKVYTVENIKLLVQVFWEDIAIAICFVRFSSLIGRNWAILIVAILFAAGHIPAMLSQGATGEQLLRLVLDAGLAALVLVVVSRYANILWFWMVHFAMDMMQFTVSEASVPS